MFARVKGVSLPKRFQGSSICMVIAHLKDAAHAAAHLVSRREQEFNQKEVSIPVAPSPRRYLEPEDLSML